MSRGIAAVVTLDLDGRQIDAQVDLDRVTGRPVSIGLVADRVGSDLDVFAYQVASLITGLMERGATLDEIAGYLPRPGEVGGPITRLIPAMLTALNAEAVRTRAALIANGLVRE